MVKTAKERQAKRRKRLKENQELYLNQLNKDHIRKAKERKIKKEQMTSQEIEEFIMKEKICTEIIVQRKDAVLLLKNHMQLNLCLLMVQNKQQEKLCEKYPKHYQTLQENKDF